MTGKTIAALFVAALSLASCLKDEAPNGECDIISARAGVPNPKETFFQLSDTVAPINADYLGSVIQFQRVTPWADLTAVAPTFTVSDGATLYPPSGTVRNFANDTTQVYFCIAEDEQVYYRELCQNGQPLEPQLVQASKAGRHIRTYGVQFKHAETEPRDVVEYDFEHYALEPKKGKYYEWSDLLPDGTVRAVSNWATANVAFATARGSAKPEEYPTIPLRGVGVDGSDCVQLTTCDTGAFGHMFGMPLAAGNMYLGTFNMAQALTNTMKATRMGENSTLDRKPVRLMGYYKFRPGAQMQDPKGEPASGEDIPAIYSLVFRNHDAEGKPVVIFGDEVDETIPEKYSPYIVARAEVTDWHKNTSEWVSFSLEYQWREPLDPALLAAKGYSYTIVLSSSKHGATFSGAIGSTLLIDGLKLYFETE